MSILSEILSTGHVDQELLDALDDEQKQLLFCQMRAEQVRKWELSELEFERSGQAVKDMTKRRVKWRVGIDGEVWVWVMGAHEKDKTIEEILDEENREKAHELAMRELHSLGPSINGPGPESTTDSDEETLMAQLERLKVGSAPPQINTDFESIYDYDTGPPPLLLFQPNGFHSQTSPSASSASSGSVTVTSFSTPQPQKAQFYRGEKPALMPKPQGYFAQFSGKSTGETPILNGAESLVINGVRMRPKPPQKPTNYAEDEEEEVQKRESEIFQTLSERREKLQKEAEAEEERRKVEWEELQRKAREAENAQRELAQKARERHQQLVRTSTSILPALKDKNATSLREAIKNLPRPPKPKSREAIVEWFKRDELPRGTGLDPKTHAPAPWFHGIISREQAEVLLMNKPTGSFLVRVSERIWGYTVSYASKDGTYKHFLVEKIPEGYQFLGTNQVVHDQLYDLVLYHETAPITAKGGEVLKWSVGQITRPADYHELLIDTNNLAAQNRSYINSNGSIVRTIPTRLINGTSTSTNLSIGRF
ncbi:unnamed protein product [Caenorhabditis angaria]|uniref:SH2 domain-containing protein n=1 Tax=Caenorhabditis angaria TaxID=860376 RepID=A0A9P1IT61_9PELO|nr:unnamed protein product [Caenorhabditis angaria]